MQCSFKSNVGYGSTSTVLALDCKTQFRFILSEQERFKWASNIWMQARQQRKFEFSASNLQQVVRQNGANSR